MSRHIKTFEAFSGDIKDLGTEKSNLKTAHVKFENPDYNYSTSVNGNLSDEEIKKYFIGTDFNVGTYPEENFETCIDCEVTESTVNEGSDNNPTKKKDILEVLEENGGEMKNKDLALASGYDLSVTEIGDPVSIFTFYEKLSKLVDQKKVKESDDKKSIILVK